MTPEEIQARWRHIPRLDETTFAQLSALAEDWFSAWQFPIIVQEQRLLLTDDLAGIVIAYGITRASAAMNHYRDYALKNRPSVGELRSFCESDHRSKTPPKDHQQMDDHYSLRERAPMKIIGVNACIAIGSQLGMERRRAREQGAPMSDAQYEHRKAELVERAHAAQQKEYDTARATGEL